MLGFLPDDGYTRTAFLKARPRIYDDVRFVYRPALIEERNNFSRKLGENIAENNELAANFCSERIDTWNIRTPKGVMVEVSAENIARLTPQLHTRILDVILGLDGGDEDPEADDAENKELRDDKAKAKKQKSSIGALREEADAKN